LFQSLNETALGTAGWMTPGANTFDGAVKRLAEERSAANVAGSPGAEATFDKSSPRSMLENAGEIGRRSAEIASAQAPLLIQRD
jgi:hypothetical protein